MARKRVTAHVYTCGKFGKGWRETLDQDCALVVRVLYAKSDYVKKLFGEVDW